MGVSSVQKNRLAVFVLALSGSIGFTAGHAAVLEEITVTAQKRAENLQDVPVAITAFSGDQVEAALIGSTEDLVKLAPGMTFTEGTIATETAFRIRGAGTQSFSSSVEPSVAVLYDGVVMTRTAQSIADLADIERIEVLRGPQGTLFGKNASAGAIHIITKRPTEAFEGSAEVMVAEDGQYGFKGTVSGPLSNTVGFRLSGNYRNDDGYIHNYATGNTVNGTENFGLRGKLEFQPTDALNILLIADVSEKDSNCCVMMPLLNEDGPDPDGFVALIAPSEPTESSRSVNQTADPDQPQDVFGFSAEVNYDLGWGGTLTSITAYRDWSWSGTPDIDFQPLTGGTAVPGSFFTFTRQSIVYGGQNHDNQVISQELRIASDTSEDTNWVAGLFYWNSQYDQNNTSRDAICIGAPGVPSIQPCPDTATSFFRSGHSIMETENRSLAVFGQVNWRPADQLELYAGVRLIQEDLEWSGYRPDAPAPDFPNDAVNTFGVPNGGTLPFQGDFETDDSNWAGKLGGIYDFTENVRMFASYSRGYKGPAANTNDFNFSTDPVEPEIVDSFEVGLRSELNDDRVHLNVTAFYSEFENFQTQTIDQVSQAFNVSNVGVFETQGVEVELNAAVTDNFLLMAGLAYTDAVFDEFLNAECYVAQTESEGCIDGKQDLSGEESPNSPDWKFNTTARYEFPLADWSAFVQGTYVWQDDVWFREDHNPRSFQESYGLLDMSVGAGSADGRYGVTLFVKNVFDEHFAANRFQIGLPPGNGSGVMILTRNADRYAGMTFNVNF